LRPSILPIQNSEDLNNFIKFPWIINREDRNWVPPLIRDRRIKLDLARNKYWNCAERELFLVKRGKTPLGTIAAIIDHHHNQVTKSQAGVFGFFECVDDQEIADLMFSTIEDWLKGRGIGTVRGPYNPSPTDECGVLIDGFNSRPALLEAHNPPYYAQLLENAGYIPFNEMVARMAVAPDGAKQLNEFISGKLLRVVEKIRHRQDIHIRQVNFKKWERDISLACDIYNKSLEPLPGYVPIPKDEFKAFADSFRSFIDPELALLAEVGGIPVAFALALPDLTEALQKANGNLGFKGLFHLWMATRNPTRGTFKILMVLPEYQNRGIETLLVLEIAQAAFSKGYREMDMSLTGSENEKSNRFQENLGYTVYRRYKLYQKSF
jgi:GNAT superfamily N-acetyltransferase